MQKKREFAIEVDGYDDKEKLIHDIFSKSRIVGTELFALDIEVAKSLLSSLDGKQIYPKDKSKKEVFKESTEEIKLKTDGGFVPDGEYVLNRNIKGFGKVNGKAIVKDGVFTVLIRKFLWEYRKRLYSGFFEHLFYFIIFHFFTSTELMKTSM